MLFRKSENELLITMGEEDISSKEGILKGHALRWTHWGH